MIYVRRLFKQDLRDGKQIAFPKEPSNLFFEFDFYTDDDRQIKFEYVLGGTIINTRIYKAGSESRIDGELKAFLRDNLNAKVDDLVIFRKKGKTSFSFEHIKSEDDLHNFYQKILKSKNHELILDEKELNNSYDSLENKPLIKSKNIREFAFLVFKYFYNNNWLTILNNSEVKESSHNENKYYTYHFNNFGKIIGEFKTPQNKESLSSSGTQRYFDELIFHRENKHYYFSTQWNAQYDDGRSFNNLKSFFETEHPEYLLIQNDNDGFILAKKNILVSINQTSFSVENFIKYCNNSGLIFSDQLIKRFVASIWTKPFVICSGLSGSGKTKLAQAFAMWICQNKSQYEIVPVGADWTNREPLLGYPNALDEQSYVKPENGILQLILNAKANENLPYFLILDEMNLSHVERYFADFLSTMESKEAIPLHKIDNEKSGTIPQKLALPSNLFIIGTVNIDETTYMFSPKVLDRANTIEFRLSEDDLEKFMASDIPLDLGKLEHQGATMAEDFVRIAQSKTTSSLDKYKDDIVKFFGELQKSGAEFGYRTTSEIGQLISHLESLGEANDNLLDIAIMQKLLPKLHGSRTKLTKTLVTLGGFCLVKKEDNIKANYFDNYINSSLEKPIKNDDNVKYKLSFEKICRMYKNAVENGFASYAEA